jgi:hypothetical protein
LFKVTKQWAENLSYTVSGETKSYNKNEGRLFGGQFLDGISNAVDVVSLNRLEYNMISMDTLYVTGSNPADPPPPFFQCNHANVL